MFIYEIYIIGMEQFRSQVMSDLFRLMGLWWIEENLLDLKKLDHEFSTEIHNAKKGLLKNMRTLYESVKADEKAREQATFKLLEVIFSKEAEDGEASELVKQILAK